MMRHVPWVFLALAVTVVTVAIAEPRGSWVTHRRFLDYLPVGSYLVLGYPRESGSYDVRILAVKQVQQRPEEFARWERKLVEMKKELVEIKEHPDANNSSRRFELELAIRNRHETAPDKVYEVIAVGEDFVEWRVKWSRTAQKGDVESAMVLPAARIREIRLPTETDRQQDRSR